MTQAFARSIKMMVAVQAAMALATISMRHAELDKIGPYRSRGKGARLSVTQVRQHTEHNPAASEQTRVRAKGEAD